MSELSNLVGVLGAIDDRVVGQPELIPEVGRLLCPYRNGAAGWYPVFREWMDDLPEFDGDAVELPELDEALAGLADFDEDATQAPDPGLRLLTLAVLGRIDANYGPRGDNAHLSRRALTVPGLAEDDDRAGALLELLTDVDAFPDSDAWDDMMSTALERELITSVSAQPLRCRGEVVEVGVGLKHPATAMSTTLVADDLDFADAVAFLDPAQWPNCGPAWCKMTFAGKTPDGLLDRYEEVIGLACPTPFLTTCLGFRKVTTNRMAVVAYKLIPPVANCQCDGRVLLDEGSIAVTDRAPDPGVTVTTTKRVLFQGVAPGPLAMFSCILGYADMGQLLVYTCAARHRAGTGKANVRMRKRDRLDPYPPRSTDEGSDCAPLFDEVATLAKECVKDTAARSRANLDKMVSGKYSTDDAAKDLATVAKRSMRDVGTAVKLGRRGLRIARESVDDPDAEEPE